MPFNHHNLTTEQSRALGNIVAIRKTKEQLIFNFEHNAYKDYDRLSNEIYKLNDALREYVKQAEGLNIPEENLNLFSMGIYTGLINPNRLSYVAYWE